MGPAHLTPTIASFQLSELKSNENVWYLSKTRVNLEKVDGYWPYLRIYSQVYGRMRQVND